MRPLKSKTALVILGTLLLGAALGDLAAAFYLGRFEDETRARSTALNARVISAPRQVISERPIDEDAAVWFQRAFDAMPELSAETVQELSALSSNLSVAEDVGTSVSDEICTKSWRSAVDEALRCSRSTWAPTNNGAYSIDGLKKVATGNCLLISGRGDLGSGDIPGGMNASLRTLAFTRDLTRGDLPMNVVAVGLARTALVQLRELLQRRQWPAVALETVRDQLGLLGPPPSFHLALESEAIELRRLLVAESRSWAPAGRLFLPIVPWRAIASWRLRSYVQQLDDLELIVDRRADEGTGFGELLADRWKSSRSDVLSRISIDTLLHVMPSADEVELLYWAVTLATESERWYGANGHYPPNGTALDIRPDDHSLRYEPTKDRQAFKIVALRPPFDDEVIFERHASLSGSQQ